MLHFLQKDYHSVYWNTRFIAAVLTWFQYLLYLGGLERNLQYLHGMPVFAAESTLNKFGL